MREVIHDYARVDPHNGGSAVAIAHLLSHNHLVLEGAPHALTEDQNEKDDNSKHQNEKN